MQNDNQYTFYFEMLRNESDLKFEDNWGKRMSMGGLFLYWLTFLVQLCNELLHTRVFEDYFHSLWQSFLERSKHTQILKLLVHDMEV